MKLSVSGSTEHLPGLKQAGFKSYEKKTEHNLYLMRNPEVNTSYQPVLGNNVTHEATEHTDNDAQLMMQENHIQQIIKENISDKPPTPVVHKDHDNHLIRQSGNNHQQSIYRNSPDYDQPIMDNSFIPLVCENLFDKSISPEGSHHQQMFPDNKAELIEKGYSYKPIVLKYDNNQPRSQEEYHKQQLIQESNSD